MNCPGPETFELKLLPFVAAALTDYLPGVEKVVNEDDLSHASVVRCFSLRARRTALDKAILDEEFPERLGELIWQDRLSEPRESQTAVAGASAITISRPPALIGGSRTFIWFTRAFSP